jgi:hypothetical protein
LQESARQQDATASATLTSPGAAPQQPPPLSAAAGAGQPPPLAINPRSEILNIHYQLYPTCKKFLFLEIRIIYQAHHF